MTQIVISKMKNDRICKHLLARKDGSTKVVFRLAAAYQALPKVFWSREDGTEGFKRALANGESQPGIKIAQSRGTATRLGIRVLG